MSRRLEGKFVGTGSSESSGLACFFCHKLSEESPLPSSPKASSEKTLLRVNIYKSIYLNAYVRTLFFVGGGSFQCHDLAGKKRKRRKEKKKARSEIRVRFGGGSEVFFVLKD